MQLCATRARKVKSCFLLRWINSDAAVFPPDEPMSHDMQVPACASAHVHDKHLRPLLVFQWSSSFSLPNLAVRPVEKPIARILSEAAAGTCSGGGKKGSRFFFQTPTCCSPVSVRESFRGSGEWFIAKVHTSSYERARQSAEALKRSFGILATGGGGGVTAPGSDLVLV